MYFEGCCSDNSSAESASLRTEPDQYHRTLENFVGHFRLGWTKGAGRDLSGREDEGAV